MIPSDFVAIDFETADRDPRSACAVGLARVQGGRLVASRAALIRPERVSTRYQSIHGIEPARMAAAEPFRQVWQRIGPVLDEVGVVVAHHAAFDRGVLLRSCAHHGIRVPRLMWFCSEELARERLGITPSNLAHVCEVLAIDLRHHDPESDAAAAARIALRARSISRAFPLRHE